MLPFFFSIFLPGGWPGARGRVMLWENTASVSDKNLCKTSEEVCRLASRKQFNYLPLFFVFLTVPLFFCFSLSLVFLKFYAKEFSPRTT